MRIWNLHPPSFRPFYSCLFFRKHLLLFVRHMQGLCETTNIKSMMRYLRWGKNIMVAQDSFFHDLTHRFGANFGDPINILTKLLMRQSPQCEHTQAFLLFLLGPPFKFTVMVCLAFVHKQSTHGTHIQNTSRVSGLKKMLGSCEHKQNRHYCREQPRVTNKRGVLGVFGLDLSGFGQNIYRSM